MWSTNQNQREGWSDKYKKSIDCDNPKGFSQKAHCAGKKKKMTEESNPRIARKKGQPAKSKKHSDLYTLEEIIKALSLLVNYENLSRN